MTRGPPPGSTSGMDFELDREEREQLSDLADLVLTGLAFVFVGLLIVEYAFALTPETSRWVDLAGWVIWCIFTVDFVVRFGLAEKKGRFLRSNWLSALAVLLPAFRVFRIFRVVRVFRSVRVVRLVAGTNRGARALARIAGFAGAGYVVLLTVLVLPLAAAGITWLERGQPGATITSFSGALWWAATTIIQQGSEQHPTTPEGRVLGLLVMIYALAVSGYITAALATFLLGRSRRQSDAGRRAPDYVPAGSDRGGTHLVAPRPPVHAAETGSMSRLPPGSA
jgi:voltage-gated potassium channel